MALIRSSVAAAAKMSPDAVTTDPPLLGVPISKGMKEGIPSGPFRRAVPSGLSGGQIDSPDATIGRLRTKDSRRHLPAGVHQDGERGACHGARTFSTGGT